MPQVKASSVQRALDGQLRLPEPNRIEQRFGRIHRTARPNVPPLNLIAEGTKGEVYRRSREA
jgi:hypothetical protein